MDKDPELTGAQNIEDFLSSEVLTCPPRELIKAERQKHVSGCGEPLSIRIAPLAKKMFLCCENCQRIYQTVFMAGSMSEEEANAARGKGGRLN